MVVVIAIASISREKIACYIIVQKPLTTSRIERVASCESIATRFQTSFLSPLYFYHPRLQGEVARAWHTSGRVEVRLKICISFIVGNL